MNSKPVPESFDSQVLKHNDSYIRVNITEVLLDGLITDETRILPFIAPIKPRYAFTISKTSRVYFCSGVKEVESPVESGCIILPVDGKISFVSYIKPQEAKQLRTWSLFTQYGLTTCHIQNATVLQKVDENTQYCKQTLKITLREEHNWGCLQLRCVVDELRYNRQNYHIGDILTIFVYKTHADYESLPFPPMVSMTRFADQNYAPLIPGQLFQIIPPQGCAVVDKQLVGDKCLTYHSKEQIGKIPGMFVYRYECIRIPDEYQLLLVEGNIFAAILLPTVFQEKNHYFTIIPEPHKQVQILCYNLNGIRLRFIKDVPIVKRYNSNYIDLQRVNTELNELAIGIGSRKVQILTVIRDNGTLELKCE